MVVELSRRANEAALRTAYRKRGDLGAAAFELFDREGGELRDDHVCKMCAPPSTRLPRPAARYREGCAAEVAAGARYALETKYILKIITGELRIGLKESLVEEAIAKAYDEPLAQVQRANMLLGDIGGTLQLAAEHRLDEARMRLFHPIGFMLASPAADAEEAFQYFEHAQVEDKYDGIRAQAHCGGGQVRLFSRTLDEVTPSFPELVGPLSEFAGRSHPRRRNRGLAPQRRGRTRDAVLRDPEAPGPQAGEPEDDGRSSGGVRRLRRDLCRRRADARQAARPSARRFSTACLPARNAGRAAPGDQRARQSAVRAGDRGRRRGFGMGPARPRDARRLGRSSSNSTSTQAMARGNEGLMIKDLQSPYMPGRRGRWWLKLKRELATLDVVVTAAEFGHGKRIHVLSDYTFAVRKGEELVNIGKAYSGLTDKEIAELTEWFLAHTTADHGHVREVEPKIVLEVAFNAIMRSDRHDSGFALRFPRIVRVRQDKLPKDIDTIETVDKVYARQRSVAMR